MSFKKQDIYKALETITAPGEGKSLIENKNVTNVVTFGNEVLIDVVINNPTLQAKKKIEIEITKAIKTTIDEKIDVPEITTECWGILNKSPKDVMCASSRMVVKRKGAKKPSVVACTLLPYSKEFEMGNSLEEAEASVKLNHPHCAKFCVLGGASCSS